MKKILKSKVKKGELQYRNILGHEDRKVVNFDNFSTSEVLSEVEKMEKTDQMLKLLKNPKFSVKNVISLLSYFSKKIFKLIIGVFCGAGLWEVMGALAPELHEKLPEFYRIIDYILNILNNMCSSIL